MAGYALRFDESEVARYRWMADRARVAEAALWEAAGITRGARIADVGCGPGAVLVLLAAAAGPTGRVVGVDGDEQVVPAARALLSESGFANAEVRVGRADDTGLEPGSFDVVMLRHVLAHNGGHEQAIVDHLASLVRPGGVVYLLDVELSGARMFPMLEDLDDLIRRYVAFHRGRGNDPSVGLRLRHLALSADLVVTDFRGWFDITDMPPGLRPPPFAAREAMIAAGAASAEDVQRWARAFERLDVAEERPLTFLPVFVALGQRPPIST